MRVYTTAGECVCACKYMEVCSLILCVGLSVILYLDASMDVNDEVSLSTYVYA